MMLDSAHSYLKIILAGRFMFKSQQRSLHMKITKRIRQRLKVLARLVPKTLDRPEYVEDKTKVRSIMEVPVFLENGKPLPNAQGKPKLNRVAVTRPLLHKPGSFRAIYRELLKQAKRDELSPEVREVL